MADPIDEILIPNSESQVVTYAPGESYRCTSLISGVAVLPGSFNPLHVGHQRLRSAAADILGQDVVYELSAVNVEKALLAETDVRQRLTQFVDSTIAITRAPRFVDKAKLFPGCCFVVGFDTAERILSPSFYNDSRLQMLNALSELRELGSRFLVGGRLVPGKHAGRFVGLNELQIPAGYGDIFAGVPEVAFREDISSTELRRRTGG